MATKAILKIILKADDTIVAESEDATLWGKVLGAISKPDQLESPATTELLGIVETERPANDTVSRFAETLGINVAQVQGALDPSTEAPYLRLNVQYWEVMKKNTPQRGPGSVTPIGFAGTLLALWLKDSGLNIPATQALASAVLNTVNVIDKNPTRGIKNTKWLQARSGGVILINPAEFSTATAIARSFCLKEWSAK